MTTCETALAPLLPALPQEQSLEPGLNLGEALRVAIEGLIANRLRSFLTTLGIIIGVSAVIVMVALGQGAARATQDAIRKLGTNVLTVMPGSQVRGGISQGLGSQQTLRPEDVDAVRKECPSVAAITPEYRGSAQVQYQNQNTRTTVYGGSPEYFDIHNLPLADGRLFSDSEVRSRAKVAVLGDSVRQSLFGDDDTVGKYVKVNGQSFQVVGTIQARGASGFRSPDDQITIPVTTAMRRVFGADYLSSISVQAVSEQEMDAAQDELMQAFTKAHRLRADQDPDVRIFNQADLTESAEAQSSVLTMLLAGIALVSLLVGGIGIMNIMLVSVTERTREIGIRKAIGAQPRDILYQFLIESVTISLAGGLIGILLGIATSLWASLPPRLGGPGFPMLLSPQPAMISFGFSALVGVFFGIYPAMKAAALDPIVALRHE